MCAREDNFLHLVFTINNLHQQQKWGHTDQPQFFQSPCGISVLVDTNVNRKLSWWRRLFRLGLPKGLLNQQTRIWSLGGLQLLLSQNQNLECEKSFGSSWRKTCGLVGLNNVLANCPMTREGEVWASQQGRKTADLNLGYYWVETSGQICPLWRRQRCKNLCISLVVLPRASCQG